MSAAEDLDDLDVGLDRILWRVERGDLDAEEVLETIRHYHNELVEEAGR